MKLLIDNGATKYWVEEGVLMISNNYRWDFTSL